MSKRTWRPKDWEKVASWTGKEHPDRGYFEAGADAMLKELRKLPLPNDIADAIMGMPKSPQRTDWDRPKGQVIFIPEEDNG